MVVFVPDISNWQGDVDMSSWWGMGIRAVIAKALEGMTGVDKKWARNKQLLANSDFIPGAYHYQNNVHAARDQCKAFLDLVPGNWIHGLDVEAPGPIDVDGWVKEYRNHYPDKVLLIYTNEPMWRNRSLVKVTNAADRYGPCAIWIAGAYRGAYQAGTDDFRKIWSRVPAGADGGLPQLGFTEYAIMQYTGSARVPGVSGPCDMGVTGSVDILNQLASPNGGKEDMPLSTDDINKVVASLTPVIRDVVDGVVHDRLANPWVNADPLLPAGSKAGAQLSPLAMILQAYLKTQALEQKIAGQTDTVEGTLAVLLGDDTKLQAAVDALNAKIGTGGTGQLSKQDVLDAVQQIVGGTRFVPEARQ
jgi:GH25 family lysozyme M1 (1,4-beta-N-acetylmuramidase)